MKKITFLFALLFIVGTTFAQNLTIQTGTKVIVTNGTCLNATGVTLTNSAGTDGLRIEDDGTLLHATDNISGTFKKAYTGQTWNFIGTPVGSVNEVGSEFENDYIRNYNEATFRWNNSNDFPEGAGRMVKVIADGASVSRVFTSLDGDGFGNGDITVNLSWTDASHGYNLVSNPYPSYVTWSLIGKTDIENNTMIYNNGSGWTSVTEAMNYQIPSGMAFYVRASSASAALTFQNADRDGDATIDAKTQLNDYLSLRTNGNGERDFLVFYEYGVAGKSSKMFGEDFVPQLYIKEKDKNYSIEVVKNIEEERTYTLGFRCSVDGVYTITTDEMRFTDNVTVHLEDNVKGTLNELNERSVYEFNHYADMPEERFTLYFNKSETSDVEEQVSSNFSTYVYANQKNIHVNFSEMINSVVSVYDITGRLLHTTNTNSTKNIINLNTVAGVYLVKVETKKGSVIKKVMIQ